MLLKRPTCTDVHILDDWTDEEVLVTTQCAWKKNKSEEMLGKKLKLSTLLGNLLCLLVFCGNFVTTKPLRNELWSLFGVFKAETVTW